MLTIFVALVGFLATPLAAQAATGDFKLSLSAPATIGLGQTYNYSATLEFEGVDSSQPASGVQLTTVLPAGISFDSVPTGPSSPVSTYTYDAATRTLTLTLKDTTQALLTIVYSVKQVSNESKYEGMPLTTNIVGTGAPSGTVTSADVTTVVEGDNDYVANKSYEVITGSDNRLVTYRFNVSPERMGSSTTFTTAGQQLTDMLPAGAELVAASPAFSGGSWDTSAWPKAVWTRTGALGSGFYSVDPTGTQIWLTVRYPASVPGWETGQRPPANTVTLETKDANAVTHPGAPATTQSPVFGAPGDPAVSVLKWDSGAVTPGYLMHYTSVAASYVGDTSTPNIDELVVTDSGATGGPNASWFNHADITQLYATFSTGLTAMNLPYKLEYQINGESTWNEFTNYTAATGRTGRYIIVAVQNTGSRGWQSSTEQDVLNLPVGSTLTGWRLTIAPGAETVPAGVQANMRMGFQPVFREVTAGVQPTSAPAAVSPGPLTNTATVTGGALNESASHSYTPQDGIYVTTRVDAPSSISVGSTGTVHAGIVNQNPSETYSDSALSVVLPCGIFYDTSQPITPMPTDAGLPTAPALGAGATVDASLRVTDANGCEQQVLKFSFDSLPPMRAPATANYRWAEWNGWNYEIPVMALAQSFDPNTTSVATKSYATVSDPRFLSTADGGTASDTIQMTGNPVFFGDDDHDFDPARTTVAVAQAQTSVNTAGGLLISKLSSASATGPWALSSQVDTDAFWQIYVSDILPNPVSGITFFDKLPSIADGDGFDTHLTGAVTGLPAGATAEYSSNATSATSGDWSADPAGATAFRVVSPSMSVGQNFTLIVPTASSGNTRFGTTDVNQVSATATYEGNAVSFQSNEASITPLAAPAFTLVKKTNGVEYAAAPGATVAVGSPVTWTYDVTNTGNTALDSVQVSDAFVDGAGTSGSLTPSSSTSGPLEPGETRTFTATGTAVAGQYANTATATATAVDDSGTALPTQPASATDDSWYFAGDSGLTVVKTTNNEDVDSAPGLPLTPGADVSWQYKVTNTGTLALTDVLVTDVDSSGNTVYSHTIPSLAPGESVELSATGTAITGQYHNTVTATAADPAGASQALTAADDSWYFGEVPGLSVDKKVSASKNGPWKETTQVADGSASYWQITVTNTGNAPLTGVKLKDPKINQSVDIDNLAAGASKTFVFTQKATTEAFTNVATVTGTSLSGKELKASDDATVTLQSKAAVIEIGGVKVPALAVTGSAITGALLLAGLMIAGSIVFLRRRRAAAE
ncbi:hypothetical protein G7068_08255 [Leucobacter viscericola]|uniref:DUF7507 domain-containing protein n=1 Tax=Leucobacter viscericola TaxID=2714935 RepID=A0A6G7XFL5_9MICO|nr:CARDB domain-containing protein [Leucobacter viscericola]QIK63187.1 hypothetical protein G7068_08255 [Leucobacter viscericola]